MTNLTKYKKLILTILILILFTRLLYLILKRYEINSFPNKPLTIIVPYKPGGGTDLNAKLLSNALFEEFKIKSKIKYVPSNDGSVGYSAISKAIPDGYTIGFINIPTFLTLPLEKITPYKKTDIYPLANISSDPCVLVVRSSEHINNLDEFLRLAKSNPYKVTISDNGLWTSDYLACVDFCNASKIDVVNVPFSGSNDMLRSLNEGYVTASIAKLSEVIPFVEKGDFKILASFTNKRLRNFRNVPTLKEYNYNVFHSSLRSIVIPQGTNTEIIKKLSLILNKSINSDYVKSESIKNNIYIEYMDTNQLIKYMSDEEKRMKLILEKLKIK